jgi:GNAT superfamily N-acetyltransferase
MRAVVVDWYNDLRAAWGLAPIEIPEEPPEELLLTDVDVRPPGEDDLAGFEEMRHAGRETLRREYPELAAFLEDKVSGAQQPAPVGRDGHVRALIAEAAGGGVCGYICGSAASAVSGRAAAVEEIFVWPEYRGLGIGRLLLESFISAQERDAQEADDRLSAKPLVQLLGSAVVLAELLEEDFETMGLFLRPR